MWGRRDREERARQQAQLNGWWVRCLCADSAELWYGRGGVRGEGQVDSARLWRPGLMNACAERADGDMAAAHPTLLILPAATGGQLRIGRHDSVSKINSSTIARTTA